MKKSLRPSCAAVIGTAALLFNPIATAASRPEPLVGAFSRIVIPTSANVAGVGGSQFRTKVAILNATTQSYTIQVTLFSTGGQLATASIPMASKQLRNYENFLADVFNIGSGFGALVFESGGTGRDFIVTSEVYNDIGQGRYKTVVSAGPLLENALPEFDSYSLGILVDDNTRTNIGFYNDSNETNTVSAEVYDAAGVLLTTVPATLAPKAWSQVGLSQRVTNGFIRWRVQGSAYCWAVVVDNKSADGTFLPAADFLP